MGACLSITYTSTLLLNEGSWKPNLLSRDFGGSVQKLLRSQLSGAFLGS